LSQEQAQRCIERFTRKKGERASMNQYWEEIAEVLAPERMGFISSSYGNNKRSEKIYDTAPLVAKRSLVNSISSMLRPKSSSGGKWFDIVPQDEELLDDSEVKGWVDESEDRLWRHMYNPKAYFMQATGEVDDDMVTFGTGCMFIGVDPTLSNLIFKSFHLKSVYLDVDIMNHVTGVFICEYLTPSQAADAFGEQNLGQKTLEKLRDPGKAGSSEKVEFVWWVAPRTERDTGIKNNLNMPYFSLLVDVESEHVVEESGFESFPFVIPRWDTRMSTDPWGRGPGSTSLPSVLGLNQMGKTILRALHRAVDPPWLLPSDSMVNAPQLRPGGVSYYDAKAIRNLGMSNPFQQMESNANIPWGLNAQETEREAITNIFFKNVLNLPVAGPQMTATEVIERRESFIREVGSQFAALESSYTGPMVERAFNLLFEHGGLGPLEEIPDVLQGQKLMFRFASPIEKAKRQIEEASISEAMEKIMAIGQIHPGIMNRFNMDEFGKFIAKANDFPHDLIRTDNEVAQLEAVQAQQAQVEQQMQIAERAASMTAMAPPELVAGAAGEEEGGAPVEAVA
jgi:hypothetical protein